VEQVEQVATYGARCDGCRRLAFELRVVDGATLCDGCAEVSARIDRRLASTRSGDRVDCDGCGERVEFDARTAVVVRECGGVVLCARCRFAEVEGREPS
jgi:hypothetical protein